MTADAVIPQERTPFLSNVPVWLIQAVIVAVTVAALGITYYLGYSEAASEALADGEEIDFELEDAYTGWSWVFLGFALAQSLVFGVRRGWAFASVIQITLIVLLGATFLLIAQDVDRDFYEVGIFVLVILTILQVPFGNIPSGANWRNSLLGLALGLVIIAAVVAFSIWLAPYLIELG